MARSTRRARTAAAVAAAGLMTSACASDPLFWEALSLAADVAIYDAMLDNCSWYTTEYGSTYQVCGDRRAHRDHDRGHRPHRRDDD
jgi:hypothetical protein